MAKIILQKIKDLSKSTQNLRTLSCKLASYSLREVAQ